MHQSAASAEPSAPPTETAVVRLLHKHPEQAPKPPALAAAAYFRKIVCLERGTNKQQIKQDCGGLLSPVQLRVEGFLTTEANTF